MKMPMGTVCEKRRPKERRRLKRIDNVRDIVNGVYRSAEVTRENCHILYKTSALQDGIECDDELKPRLFGPDLTIIVTSPQLGGDM